MSKPRWWIGTVVAAGVVLVAGMAGVRWMRPAGVVGSGHTYTTHSGQQAVITLSDGTRVTLAPQTALNFDAGFGTKHRTVRVTGQAYFDVASAAGQPFVVRAGAVTSRVLGTAFTVRHYAEDRDVVVAVESGKVSAGRHNPVVLTRNTVARIGDSTVVLTTNADLREYTEWRVGRLVFVNAPASEVAAALGRWYGLSFRFADSTMSHRSLSGAFDNHESTRDVLQNLQILLGAHMTFEGNVVIIHSNRTAPPRERQTLPVARRDVEVGR